MIVPALDEAPAIGAAVDALKQTFAGRDEECEIIVVDDGSSDATARVAAEHGARVLRHPCNLGYGRSLKDGMLAASHDTIAIIDADGTYPAAELGPLLDRYAEGFDMVVGARASLRAHDSLLKAPLRTFLRWLVEFTTGQRIPDVNSGLRVFGRAAALPHLVTLCDTFSFTTSLTLAYCMQHKSVGYLPIRYENRVGRTKVRLLRDSLRTLQYVVQAIVRYNPFKLFLLLVAADLVFSGLLLVLGIATQQPAGLWLAAAGVLTAFLLLGLSLVADLIRQSLERP